MHVSMVMMMMVINLFVCMYVCIQLPSSESDNFVVFIIFEYDV